MATITFTPIPTSSPDILAPGRGAEQWHNGSARIPNPTESQPVGVENSPNVYYRRQWTQFEGAEKGSYNWTDFDNIIKGAITKGQRLSFGIMTLTPGSEQGHASYGGAKSSYPEWVHKGMQAETNKDWIAGDTWIPNWNSKVYLDGLKALHEAIKNRLLTQRFTPTSGPNSGKSVLYSDAIYVIDIRGYGSWGEWHTGSSVGNWDQYPAGRAPTAATLKAIIDLHTSVFDKWPLVIMIAAFDGGGTQIPLFQPYPEVAHYAATAKNAWGPVGWRKDQYGATDGYLAGLLENNNITWNGSQPLKNILMNTWKVAPITGEPPAWTPDGPDLIRQVSLYHTTSFGNGNYGPYPNAALRNVIRDAFKKCGYRLIVPSVDVTTSGSNLTVKMNWQNVGLAPTYENWNVVFELVASNGNIAWSTISSFRPKGFLPASAVSPIAETFTPAIPAGTYQLRFAVKDPTGYMTSLPLAISGGDTSNRYSLGNVTVGGGTPPVNKPPVVNAGSDIEITLPVNSVQLVGSATDPDGTIATYKWDKISGSGVITNPAVANTTVTNLTEGITIVRLTATDNAGASNTDETKITVKKADVPPPQGKTVVDVKNVSTVTTVSTIIYSDGSTEVFPKP